MKTLRIAMHALRRNVMRSSLTCLGIIIGIAAVIAMAEIGRGSARQVEQAISRIGANVVQIDPSDMLKAGASSGIGGRMTLVPADAEAIARECSGVQWAAPSVDCRSQVVYGNRNYSPQNVLGTTPDYLKIRDWKVVEGEAFLDEDVVRGAAVCLMGQVPARELFGDESPIGKEVRVNNVTLRVIGLLDRKGASPIGRDLDDIVLVPWTTVKFRLSGTRTAIASAAAAGSSAAKVNSLQAYPSQPVQLYPAKSAAQIANFPLLARFTDVDDVWVSVQSPEARAEAKRQITLLLRERHRLADEAEDDFRIRDWTEIAGTVAETNRLFGKLLLCVALISLLVGGVGIMNIMLVSVTERTREIGIRMAAGARAKDILRQFLVEAAILCVAGGVLGIALGRGVSIAATMILGWPTMSSVPAIAAAVGVSVLVGLVFGYYPAWRASRLDPIEALRHE